MKDILEIAGDAYERACGGLTYSERKIANERLFAVIRALEAAGFVIVRPDEVTDEMMHEAIRTYAATKQAGGELHNAIAAALRAAPKHGGEK